MRRLSGSARIADAAWKILGDSGLGAETMRSIARETGL